MGKNNKHLGVLINNELKFHKQTTAAIKTANPILCVVRKSSSFFDDRHVLIYKSHLGYGDIVWGPFFKYKSLNVSGHRSFISTGTKRKLFRFSSIEFHKPSVAPFHNTSQV